MCYIRSMDTTYTIPEYNWPWVQKQLKKLNRRADKLGCAPIVATIVGTEMVPVKEYHYGETVTVYVRKHTVLVTGEAPKYAGWTFVATLQHTADGNITRAVPGEELPEEYRDKPRWCDHCQASRLRKDTYVVRNADGKHMQVGRQCLRDFLGHKSPHQLAEYAEWLANFSEWAESEEEREPGTRRAAFTFDTISLLAWVAYWTRTEGWVSRTTAREAEWHKQATADLAVDMLLPGGEKWKQGHVRAAEDISRAKQALEWCLTDLALRPHLSDYDYNLTTACKAKDGIEYRNTGLVASLIRTWDRAMDRVRERKAQAAALPPSNHVGSIGERITIKVTVLSIKDIPGDWGVSHLHRMQDAEGNVLVWFASAAPLEVGSTYTIKGTVKAHDVYQDRKQTRLQRCTVQEG